MVADINPSTSTRKGNIRFSRWERSSFEILLPSFLFVLRKHFQLISVFFFWPFHYDRYAFQAEAICSEDRSLFTSLLHCEIQPTCLVRKIIWLIVHVNKKHKILGKFFSKLRKTWFRKYRAIFFKQRIHKFDRQAKSYEILLPFQLRFLFPMDPTLAQFPAFVHALRIIFLAHETMVLLVPTISSNTCHRITGAHINCQSLFLELEYLYIYNTHLSRMKIITFLVPVCSVFISLTSIVSPIPTFVTRIDMYSFGKKTIFSVSCNLTVSGVVVPFIFE